jgi:hypothetical protein
MAQMPFRSGCHRTPVAASRGSPRTMGWKADLPAPVQPPTIDRQPGERCPSSQAPTANHRLNLQRMLQNGKQRHSAVVAHILPNGSAISNPNLTFVPMTLILVMSLQN